MIADTYKEMRTFNFPNITARVYFPDLTQEEREKRFKAIYDASVNLVLEAEKRGIVFEK